MPGRAHKPLPRILTSFRIKHTELRDDDIEEVVLKPKVFIPEEVVSMIIDWVGEFERAAIKEYYYGRFMSTYLKSLVKSSSRLKLYTRELKSYSMKHQSLGAPPTLMHFIRDSQRCKRKYDYESLSGIFF